MKAVILAAGMGKRLKDITLNTPKPLLKIANTTIIHYLVSCLKEIGIKDIYVVTGFKSKMIKKELGNLEKEHKTLINDAKNLQKKKMENLLCG